MGAGASSKPQDPQMEVLVHLAWVHEARVDRPGAPRPGLGKVLIPGPIKE